MSFLSGLGSFLSGGLTDLIGSGSSSSGYQGTPWQGLTDPGSWWDTLKNGKTNFINQQIAAENLGFQRDALEYNKWLNQEIFNRADTAYQRQAKDAQAIGINPMALASTGGAQTGGSVSPIESMHNDFQMQDIGVLQALAPVLSAVDSINGVLSGKSDRDLLAAQADKQRLENLVYAHKNDLHLDSDGNWVFDVDAPHKNKTFEDLDIENKKETNRNLTATANRNERVDERQEEYGYVDDSTVYEKILTGAEAQAKNSFNKVFNAYKTISNPYALLAKGIAIVTGKASKKLKKDEGSIADKMNRSKKNPGSIKYVNKNNSRSAVSGRMR